MKNEKRKLNICHLYAKESNVNGDRGNVIALYKRCKWRGIKSKIISVGIDEEFDSLEYDIIFLGGSEDYKKNIILNDLMTKKRESLIKGVQKGIVFLFVCGGYGMMGEYYIDQSGKRIDCVGAIPVTTIEGKDRLKGNIICESKELKSEEKDSLLVGFENHLGRTFLGDGVEPLGEVITGFGNNGEDRTEGARYKNVFCTYMHGSFLPKNPKMADKIIQLALLNKYPGDFHLEPLEDLFEKKAREVTINKSKE